MVTMAAHKELEARVEKLEQQTTAHTQESIAGKFSVLRAMIATYPDEELRKGALLILADLERRLRPLSIALERAEHRAEARQQLLDEATR